jgi:hypothetical protein
MSTSTSDLPPERRLAALLRRLTTPPPVDTGGALPLEPVVSWPMMARVPGAARRLRQQQHPPEGPGLSIPA